MPVITRALIKSIKRLPTMGIAKKEIGEGPYFFVITYMLAIALEVAPIAKPMKPAVMTAAS